MTLPIYFHNITTIKETSDTYCFGSQPSTSCSANIRFSLLWCCGASWSSLMSWSLSTISKHGIILGRPIWCYTPFLLLILLLSLICCSPTVCHHMVLPCGSSHVLPFTQSRSLLTTYSDASGIFYAIATPEFYTLLPACPVCSMLSFLRQHVLLWLFERFWWF